MARSTCPLVVLALAGCGGSVEDDEDLVVSEEDSALSTGADDEDGAADEGCRDGDHDGHKEHRKHWFKVLDKLDGEKDKAITIASLPAGLPDRLIAKLNRIDENHDGLVTKKEAKAARPRPRRGNDENRRAKRGERGVCPYE